MQVDAQSQEENYQGIVNINSNYENIIRSYREQNKYCKKYQKELKDYRNPFDCLIHCLAPHLQQKIPLTTFCKVLSKPFL